MKSKCKPIYLSQKNKIKAIVINLIAQVLLLAVFTWSLVQSITMHLPDQYILGSILLVIGAVIAIISFLRDLKKAFSKENGYDATFAYSMKNDEQIAAAIGKSRLIKKAFIVVTRQESSVLNGMMSKGLFLSIQKVLYLVWKS